jgi:hypothetical protein
MVFAGRKYGKHSSSFAHSHALGVSFVSLVNQKQQAKGSATILVFKNSKSEMLTYTHYVRKVLLL